jgi:hypothetical protein
VIADLRQQDPKLKERRNVSADAHEKANEVSEALSIVPHGQRDHASPLRAWMVDFSAAHSSLVSGPGYLWDAGGQSFPFPLPTQ